MLRRAAVSLAESCSGAAAALRSQGTEASQACLQQQRGYLSVDVPNGNVDRAWKALSRKLKEEGMAEAASSRQYFVKPSERRKQAASAAANRFRKQEFNDMLNWIMRRQARGF